MSQGDCLGLRVQLNASDYMVLYTVMSDALQSADICISVPGKSADNYSLACETQGVRKKIYRIHGGCIMSLSKQIRVREV